MGIQPQHITGYDEQVMTHTEVARAVSEGRADTGLGIEAAALAYGLDFLFLTSERYDLVIPAAIWTFEPVQRLIAWLSRRGRPRAARRSAGYDLSETGHVDWVE